MTKAVKGTCIYMIMAEELMHFFLDVKFHATRDIWMRVERLIATVPWAR